MVNKHIMPVISKTDREKLYLYVKHEMGYPIRKIFELTEDMMDSYLEMVIEDYSSYVNNWLIEQQWVALQGLSIDSSDFLEAYTSKSTDFMESFTFAYSKQVGLGMNAPAGETWHLKRDYVTISADTQIYVIPAGREINEILWSTPPQIDSGLVDPFALQNWSASNFGWSYLGRPAQYVQPTYSLLLSAQDSATKRRILQSELTYRVTGGPNGTKLLYLYPIPGDRFEISNGYSKHYEGSKVWYFYYNTNDQGRDKCLENNSDIIRLPSDAPIDVIRWDKLNSVAKTQIRDLFIAKCKIVIGGIRGFYSGELGSAQKDLTMDYRHLLEEGQQLKEATVTAIMQGLGRLSLVQLTRDRAEIAQNVNKERGFQPPMFPIMTA
jgi:hypothetical protein